MGALDGKVAVVTGAGRGIGRGIALMFAAEGAQVVVNDLGGKVDGEGGEQNVADEVVDTIKAAGGEAVANYESVAHVEGGQLIFQQAIDAFGALDILVNNAGILRDITIFNMKEPAWDAVIDVHLKGHYCCTRPFARYIRETNRQGCRIFNLSSTSGLLGNFGQINYGAAKAGIAGFTRVLALELEKYGTGVITISPGAVTRMTEDLHIARGKTPNASDPTQGPQQIAPVVTWLASKAGDGITDEIIHISGGNVGIMQQPAVIRSFNKPKKLWTLPELDEVVPQLLDAKVAHDEAVEKSGVPEEI